MTSMFHRLLLVALLVLATGCDDAKKCKETADCETGQLCRQKKCQDAPEGSKAGAARPDPGEEGSADEAPVEAFSPESAREKLTLFNTLGRDRIAGTVTTREELFQDIRVHKITLPQHRYTLAKLVDELNDFRLGIKPHDIETAPKRLCTIFAKGFDEGNRLYEETDVGVLKIKREISELESQEAAFAKKAQEIGKLKRRDEVKRVKNNKRIRTLEDQLTPWNKSKNVLAHWPLLLRNFLEDAYTLADFGAKRTQAEVKACLTPFLKKKARFDIEGKVTPAIQHVVTRASTYLKE
jgi:hypothetical protein